MVLAAELRAVAAAIEELGRESRCWSVIQDAVHSCTDHITAIAGNSEKTHRILELETKIAAFELRSRL